MEAHVDWEVAPDAPLTMKPALGGGDQEHARPGAAAEVITLGGTATVIRRQMPAGDMLDE